MSYRVLGETGRDPEEVLSTSNCRPSRRVRVQRIVFEDDANLNANTTITAPVGTVIEPACGTIVTPYRIESNKTPCINCRVENGSIVVEGLVYGTFYDFHSGGGAPCPQHNDASFVIPVLQTIPANIRNQGRFITDSFVKEMDFNAIGFPDIESPGKTQLQIGVTLLVEICITRPENIEC